MEESYWWYVLFVKSGTENRVIKDIQTALETANKSYRFDCFTFESEQYFRSKSKRILGKSYRRKPIFPGYVFIETDMPEKIFLERFSNLFFYSSDVIRLLNTGTIEHIALPLAERQQLEFLYLGKRCLEHSIGYKEGDKITITQGPLVGREGLIKYINRHNREAIIEIEMFNKTINAKVALELITK